MQELGNWKVANRENSETEDCPTLLTLLGDEINRILNFTYCQTPNINSVSSEAERDKKMEDKVAKLKYNFCQMRERSSPSAANWATTSKENCVDSRDGREKYCMESRDKT